MNFDTKKFSKLIGKLIEFKSGVTKLPIKATSWEELIWAALVFMYGDGNVDWDSQSHEKSVDIKVKVNGRVSKISAKGGAIKEGLLTVSSYRLTTFNKLKDKLNFIKNQHKNFNFYLICAREINQANKTTNYIVIKIPALAGGAGMIERWFLCKTCNNVYEPRQLPKHVEHEIMKHPTQKPLELSKKLIKSAMPKKNGVVLVPFVGTGSECVAAKELGQNYIGFELNPDYIRMAEKWLTLTK